MPMFVHLKPEGRMQPFISNDRYNALVLKQGSVAIEAGKGKDGQESLVIVLEKAKCNSCI